MLFCGEEYPLTADRPFRIGRVGDLAIDDNQFLHRCFLQIEQLHGLWLMANVGTSLSATVTDRQSLMQAWLAPGARIPLAFSSVLVWFTAGPTTYEFEVELDESPFSSVAVAASGDAGRECGGATVGAVCLTTDQRRLIVALTEDALRRGARWASAVPSSADAAARLGWTMTRFNRKLDNVCGKLAANGVRGLHGEPGSLAVNRRARLAEYALATQLVTVADLQLLDADPAGSPRISRTCG